MTTELLTESGSWECPSGVSSVTVECWGAGGYARCSGGVPCGGAGGGAYAKKAVSVTPGESYTYNIAISGCEDDTYWVNATTVMAKSGQSVDATVAGGLGGQASESVGDVKYSGGNGADADVYYSEAGGGGGGAGSTGPGKDAFLYTGGGATPEYGGAGGSLTPVKPYNYLNDGEDGYDYGGGASGGLTSAHSGGQGLIRITYTIVPIFQTVGRGMFSGSFRSMR